MSDSSTEGETPQPPAKNRVRRIVRAVLLLLFAGVLTVVVFVYRDEIASHASLGYGAVFIVCLLLNAGVFGLSPSGLVAVEVSFLLDPLITAIVAGLGAGAGETVSYFTGMTSDDVVPSRHGAWLRGMGAPKLMVLSFGASLVSGNLSDGMGLVCGRAGVPIAWFLMGAVCAKVVKMLALVMVTHNVGGAVGVLHG